jgi:hypothetical protein
MANRLYVLGAGASCAQGLPAMATLTWEICDFLTGNDRSVLERVIVEAFGVRHDPGEPSPNFEELLNRIDSRSLTYLGSSGIDVQNTARMRAIEIALRGLREYIREKCIAVKDELGPYDRFVTSLDKNAIIVSFNWDVLLELALLRAGRHFSYLPDRNLDDQVVLLKPHGSVNWFALLDREMLIVDTSANVDLVGGSLQYYLVYLKDPLGPVDMGSSSPFATGALSKVPAIVPPSSVKLLDVGGQTHDGFVDLGHGEAMSAIWNTFYEQVRGVGELVIVGYSLPGTDAASIEVLKEFSNHSPGRRVSIIDKSEDVLQRYREIVHPDVKLVHRGGSPHPVICG